MTTPAFPRCAAMFLWGAIVLTFPVGLAAEPLRLLGWNLDAGGSTPAVNADRLTSFSDIDLFVLLEAPGDRPTVDLYTRMAGYDEGLDYKTCQDHDGILLLYDPSRLKKRKTVTMKEAPPGSPGPLIVRFEDRDAGRELFLVAWRLDEDAGVRRRQVTALREWTSRAELPVLGFGDFQFAYDPQDGPREGDGFQDLTENGALSRIEPLRLLSTHCRKTRPGPCETETVSDWAFVSSAAAEWSPMAMILALDHDFPDDETTSDHRPVFWTVEMP